MSDRINRTSEISAVNYDYGYAVGTNGEECEDEMFMRELENKLEVAERQIENGEVFDAFEALAELRQEYGI